jgi:hypothetical protein
LSENKDGKPLKVTVQVCGVANGLLFL